MSPIRVPRSMLPSRLAEKLIEMAGLVTFGALFRQLAPDTFARTVDKTPLGYYVSLCRHLETMFPINTFAVDMAVEGVTLGDNSLSDLVDWGIPVEVQGFRDDQEYYDPVVSPAACVCLCFVPQSYFNSSFLDYSTFGALDDYRDILGHAPHSSDLRKLRPPRGHKWFQPWDGLPDLMMYVHHTTGYDFLDFNQYDLDESGAQLPAWNMDEITGLAQAWKECKCILERAINLQDYIDKRPEERLPILAGVLAGDREALRDATYPVQRSKTLAEVFA